MMSSVLPVKSSTMKAPMAVSLPFPFISEFHTVISLVIVNIREIYRCLQLSDMVDFNSKAKHRLKVTKLVEERKKKTGEDEATAKKVVMKELRQKRKGNKSFLEIFTCGDSQ